MAAHHGQQQQQRASCNTLAPALGVECPRFSSHHTCNRRAVCVQVPHPLPPGSCQHNTTTPLSSSTNNHTHTRNHTRSTPTAPRSEASQKTICCSPPSTQHHGCQRSHVPHSEEHDSPGRRGQAHGSQVLFSRVVRRGDRQQRADQLLPACCVWCSCSLPPLLLPWPQTAAAGPPWRAKQTMRRPCLRKPAEQTRGGKVCAATGQQLTLA
jgi:hypothetical protein